MLLFVYSTTGKRFVIFTCRHFKLSWNTTALSESNCRNFSCSSITQQKFDGFRIPQAKISIPGFQNPGCLTSVTPVILFCRFLLSFPFVLSRKTRLVTVSYIHSRAFYFLSNIPIFALSLSYFHFPFHSQSANGYRSGLLFSDLRSHCESNLYPSWRKWEKQPHVEPTFGGGLLPLFSLYSLLSVWNR